MNCDTAAVLVHDGESENCWCVPDLLQPCPECTTGFIAASGPEGAGHYFGRVVCEPRDPDCWRCEGRGVVPQFDEGAPLIVAHRVV